jgi:isoleucyl-tRNA synthetase
MSKSLGNIVEPKDVVEGLKSKGFLPNGADVLRYWVASANISHEISIGPQVIDRNSSSVKKIRNTLRYMLGVINRLGFKNVPDVGTVNLKPLDRWALGCLAAHVRLSEQCFDNFEFSRFTKASEALVTNVLSQTYFEAMKSHLYSDHVSTEDQRARGFVMLNAFNCLTKTLSPILPFLMQDVLEHTPAEIRTELFGSSVTPFCSWPVEMHQWEDDDLLRKFNIVISFREKIHSILEAARVDEKFFKGDFSEVGLELYFPTDISQSCLYAAISDLQKHEQLNQLLSVTECSIFASGDRRDSLSEYHLAKELTVEVEEGVEKTVQVVLVKQINKRKCRRCRRLHEAALGSEIEVKGEFDLVCQECLDTLTKYSWCEAI